MQTENQAAGYMTPEREMLRNVAREFTDKEVLPVANALDPEKGLIPQDLIDKMGDLGFFGITIPEEYGGAGLGAFEYCLVAEELARGWMSVASLLARANNWYRNVPGTGEEREKRIRLMAEGKYFGALAMSEPDVGSDLSSITCRAHQDGDEWVINGSKYWCTFADGADFIQVMARTDEGESRHQGLTGINVEKPRGELPEGCTGSPIPKIGYHGWKTWELHFDNVRAPITEKQKESRGRGFYGIARGLQTARAHTAARSIGLAQGALEQAIEYAKERIQFRRPDRRLPGDPLQDRQHGDRGRGGPTAELLGARQDRHRCRLLEGGGDGEVLRRRDVRARRLRRPAGPRRSRLHHRLPRRTLLARRATHQDLRGHLRDHAEDRLGLAARQAQSA